MLNHSAPAPGIPFVSQHQRRLVLAQAVKAEGDPQRVAELYEIPLRAVNRAVRFEDWLAQAA